jgi:D-aspartate ligase
MKPPAHVESPCAVVLGMGPTALAIVRELGRHGVPAYGIGLSPWEVSFRSRYCRKIDAIDPRENPEALCVRLEEFASVTGLVPRVLYPSGDECVEFLARHAPRLKPHYLFSDIDAATCDCFLNKRKFYHLCRSVNVPTIETLFPAGHRAAVDMAAALEFPCFLKPIYYHTWARRYGLRKGFLCRTREEYLRAVDQVADTLDNIMIQEVVEGPEDNLRFVILYVARDGTTPGCFTGRKLRQYPPDFGTGSAVISSPEPQIIENATTLLRAAGYKGLAEIEFKWCAKSRQFKSIEVNIRPCRLGGLASAAGVDLIYSSFLDLTGQRMPVLPVQVNGIKWLFPVRDIPAILHNVRHRHLTLAQAARSYQKPRTWCVWAPDDRMPFLAYFGEMLVKATRHYLLPRKARPAGIPAPG